MSSEPTREGVAASGHEPVRLTYALVRGEQYVHTEMLVKHLREQGWDEIADWLKKSAEGPITRRETFRVRR